MNFSQLRVRGYVESNAGIDKNISFIGNTITNGANDGYLGDGDNTVISYNYFSGNGSNTPQNHTIYNQGEVPHVNLTITGNYITGQNGSTCNGAPIVAHGEYTNINVSGNYIYISPTATTGGCWGITFNNIAGYTVPIYFRNAVFNGNMIVNGGNQAIAITSCPGCVITNNVIVNDSSSAGVSIELPANGSASRSTYGDDINTANVVENNTIYYTSNVTSGGTGIQINTEGTGHIVANNVIYYTSSSGTLDCFNYGLGLSAYAFLNNNDCHKGSGTPVWEANHGSTLSTWQTYAASYGFDSASILTDPLFTAPTATPPSFIPNTGSPLIGAGNHTYAPLTDALAVTRPDPPAIGAFEP